MSDVPELVVRFDGKLTEEQVETIRQAFRDAIRTQQPMVLAEPHRWVLVRGWHESGKIEAVYGPYTEERARWLLSSMLEYATDNWTLTELQDGPL